MVSVSEIAIQASHRRAPRPQVGRHPVGIERRLGRAAGEAVRLQRGVGLRGDPAVGAGDAAHVDRRPGRHSLDRAPADAHHHVGGVEHRLRCGGGRPVAAHEAHLQSLARADALERLVRGTALLVSEHHDPPGPRRRVGHPAEALEVDRLAQANDLRVVRERPAALTHPVVEHDEGLRGARHLGWELTRELGRVGNVEARGRGIPRGQLVGGHGILGEHPVAERRKLAGRARQLDPPGAGELRYLSLLGSHHVTPWPWRCSASATVSV